MTRAELIVVIVYALLSLAALTIISLQLVATNRMVLQLGELIAKTH
jgi:hypothetical protein